MKKISLHDSMPGILSFTPLMTLYFTKKAANEAAQRQKLQWFIIFNDLCFPYPE
ncbi:hypothetical protein AADE18_004197 [Salmonella enterica]